MSKFKVGDLVTGTSMNCYGYTNSSVLMEVVHVSKTTNTMKVKIVMSKNEYDLGRIYDVNEEYFRLESPKEYSKRIGLIIRESKAVTKSAKQEDAVMKKFEIKDYKVIGNKVVIVEFADGDIQKSVCMEGDIFDEERGLEVCIMKHLLGKSNYHKALKEANKQIVALDEKAKAEKAEAEKLEKKKAKNAKNKADRKAKRRAENIADMTEAFTAALKANGVDINVKDVPDGVLDKILNVFKK